jgi:hypothetical protein
MSSTALERRPEASNGIALFPGSNADEIIAVAADAATKFGDIVRRQRMFKRIGESDHIQIEAWQTIGALTGVVASTGEVEQLPWPTVEPLGEEPPVAGREPRNRDSAEWQTWKHAAKLRATWELHDELLRARAMGKAYGFACRYTATKNGAPVGWGEGSVDRNEENWVRKDDHELRSMAQTRSQSRALGAPLKFVVKLAGYETTPAEEMDGTPAAPDPAQAQRIVALERELAEAQKALEAGQGRWGKEATDDQMNQAAQLVRTIAHPTPVEGEQFIVAMGSHLDGVPEVCVTMLRGLARFITQARTQSGIEPSPENAPPPPEQSAYPQPKQSDVYPESPGGGPRYHGD